MTSEIAVPFRLDTSGRVVMTDDPDDRVHLHVLALLNTSPTERMLVPGYGTEINSLVFADPDGDAVAAQAALLVRDAFRTYEPGVDLVSADPDYDKSQENLALINVEYRRLDAPDSAAVVSANTAIIGANGTVREIVRG